MSDRIRQLEDALAITDGSHPLLSRDLLKVGDLALSDPLSPLPLRLIPHLGFKNGWEWVVEDREVSRRVPYTKRSPRYFA